MTCRYCGQPFEGPAVQRFCSRTCARYGKPHRPRSRTETIAVFWSYVARATSRRSCWPWRGARSSNGYVRFDNRVQLAHRVAYRLAHPRMSRVPMLVNTCGHVSCCNPAHWRPRRSRASDKR
jgi:hypothetical protein